MASALRDLEQGMVGLKPEVLELLACPHCGSALNVDDSGATCAACGNAFPRTHHGQLDLRLRESKTYITTFTVGGSESQRAPRIGPIPPNPSPGFEYRYLPIPRQLTLGNRITRELLSYFPRFEKGGVMLDLGCGSEPFREICSHTNLEYVGMDYEGDIPRVLGDAHSLPFTDEAFKFVVSFAAMEHFRNPFVAMCEVARVLRPGGLFIGTGAFLEPYHLNSYFHLSHLGMQHVLASSGLEVMRLEPNAEWMGLQAQASMSLFPHMPTLLARLLVLPVKVMHRVWWKIGHRLQKREATSEHARRLANTAGFRFICRKPKA